MGIESEIVKENLDYYRSRQCRRQWRTFLNAFTAELFAHAGMDDARGFMRELGRRMSADITLGECESLDALEHAMNRYWDEMDWGWCRLEEDDRAIVIRHGAWPAPSADPQWQDAFVALLEGLYTGWLQAQGGDERLVARSIADQESAGVLQFHYAH